MCGNVWAMKRSVQIDADILDYHLAKFTIFALAFFLLNRQIVNLADFKNTHRPFGKPLLAMFYSRPKFVLY
jgi:hypothetical protein